MSKSSLVLAILVSTLFVGACDSGDRRKGEINLPEGDPEQGKAEFIALGCVGCHVVVGAELPEPAADSGLRVVLGSSNRVMTYGDLVTSVVNPSHRLSRLYRESEVSVDGQSLMTSYNDVMTVKQLTDLVAFLQSHYQRMSRPRYRYRTYDYVPEDAAQRVNPDPD